VTEVQEAIRDRDRRDRERPDSPLLAAEGSVDIDTTDLTPDQVVERIVGLARDRGVA
jgi:cytidylate kinase